MNGDENPVYLLCVDLAAAIVSPPRAGLTLFDVRANLQDTKMNEHEEKFIRVFIVPDKRDRYLSLFATEKGRRKLTDRLDHNDDLDARYLHEIPGAMQSANSVLALLKQRCAPSKCCHLDQP